MQTYLFVVVAEDGGRVLAASVVALSVAGRGVVEHVEVLHQLLVRRLVAIEHEVKHFHVASVSITYITK